MLTEGDGGGRGAVLPGTFCGAGRDAGACLPAVLAEKGGLTGSLAAAVEDGRYRTVERNGRGPGFHPEGSDRRVAIFASEAKG